MSDSHSEDPQRGAPDHVAALEKAIFEVKRIVVGQEAVIERLLACLLAKGHCLLEGVPGLAKTLLAETLATSVGGTFKRIQFTPDLLPADVTGTRIYRASTEQFDVELGPIFANFVLTDEINRAPAKVQSALLEVMGERKVSIGGTTFPAPEPFLVMATQNPIESEGVYPLPEAQQDRFLMKILVQYPTPLEELEIVHRMGVMPPIPSQVLSAEELVELQKRTSAVYVDPAVVQYAVNLVVATREPERYGLSAHAKHLTYGCSPRASLGLVAAARGLAVLRRRNYVLPQDIADIAPDVMRHRLVLSYEALADDVTADAIVGTLLRTVPAPYVAPSQHPSAPGQSAAHVSAGTPPPGANRAWTAPAAPAGYPWDTAPNSPPATPPIDRPA
ncbi:MAG: AAA family ATPase [Candidatus Dormibacteria bacterium]